MNRCTWTSNSSSAQKPWGFEIQWGGIFCGKEIHLNAGHRTSLKFHLDKNELLYIQEGMIQAEIADVKHFQDPAQVPARFIELGEGDVLNVQAGCAYRLTAKVDSVVFEISDGESRNNSIRLEDDYGRKTIEPGKYIFVHPEQP